MGKGGLTVAVHTSLLVQSKSPSCMVNALHACAPDNRGSLSVNYVSWSLAPI